MIMAKYKSDRFYQVYGMTESGRRERRLCPKIRSARLAPSGGRTAGCDIVVMKTTGQEAKRGEVGEIWLKADSMMKGYTRTQMPPKKSLKKSWYKTGDVARLTKMDIFHGGSHQGYDCYGWRKCYSKEVEISLQRARCCGR